MCFAFRSGFDSLFTRSVTQINALKHGPSSRMCGSDDKEFTNEDSPSTLVSETWIWPIERRFVSDVEFPSDKLGRFGARLNLW